jgi:hypothetical protein
LYFRAKVTAVLNQYFNRIGGRPDRGNAPTSKKSKARPKGPGTAGSGTKRAYTNTTKATDTQSDSARGRKKRAIGNGESSKDLVLVHVPASRTEYPPEDGQWGPHVNTVETIEEITESDGTTCLYGLLIWNDGSKTRHRLRLLHQRIPEKVCLFAGTWQKQELPLTLGQMLDFYEQHL